MPPSCMWGADPEPDRRGPPSIAGTEGIEERLYGQVGNRPLSSSDTRIIVSGQRLTRCFLHLVSISSRWNVDTARK
jgi:hypothetical protein